MSREPPLRQYTYFPAKTVPSNEHEHFVQFEEAQPPYYIPQPQSEEERRRTIEKYEIAMFMPIGAGIICFAFLAVLTVLIYYGLGSGI
ncbi:hypothetical protein DdX_06581 [Ditylenchus destructor]|uniref:Uncharacterized protein n=1 Tax=Ditylenchus destructor TaxID=166010 RepID=A0AAD4NBB8_9BILA|nr:hypothetical protein DdX_06581 [Ditylenchus destructor]